MSDFPASWMGAPLGDISHVEMGQSPNSRFYNDRGEGLPFFQGKAEFGALYPTVWKWCSEPKKIAEAGDILLSVRAPVGPTNIANERCCIGRGLAAIRANEPIAQEYLLHFFRYIQPWLSEQGTGTTFTAVSGDFLRALQVTVAPPPPPNEQKRIADKLDAVLARVDACRERLDRVPAILKRFRQSVLAAATSGKLTEEWRAVQSDDPDWRAVRLAEVVSSRLGKMLEKAKNQGIPTPYLRNVNVRWFGFDLSDIQQIKVTSQEKADLVLEPGDVLVCEGGEPGRCAIWRVPDSTYVYQKALHRVRVGTALLPEWLCYSLKNAADSGRLSDLFTGTTIKHLTGVALGQFELQLPPVDEQQEIIRRVESLFAYADRLEARYTAARAQVERLTPALLTKAFRGELVPQNPNDEPAAVLLERIRAAREAAPDKRRARQGKPRRTGWYPCA